MADSSTTGEAVEWARETLANVVQEISDQGVIDSPLLEARPAWSKPFDIVIGKLRDQGEHAEFLWVIGGSVPIDWIHSSVASTARDAARHFSMKWQLDAMRFENPKDLVNKAQYLYSVTDDDQFWS